MKTTLSIIAAALVSGAAYGHSPCPEPWIEFPDMPLEQQLATIDQWRENERIEDERDYREQMEQIDRDYQRKIEQIDREETNDLLQQLIDAVSDRE